MPGRTPREIELERALINLRLSAAPFAKGHGLLVVRENLSSALTHASKALKNEPCARDPRQTLRDAADRADAERRNDPNFRKDTDG